LSTPHDTAAGAVLHKAASAATYGGSGAAVYFGMTANEIAAFGGLFIATMGLLINWWYKHQHLKLARIKIEDEQKTDE
jgi:hypothetical protein